MKKKPISLPISEMRLQAEEKLKKHEKEAKSPKTKADIQRLLHELQVHQIELQMQNEELLRTKSELEWTLNQYTELYAFAPAGYFTLTDDGTIRRVNLTGTKLLGLGLSDIIKRRFQVFVSPTSRTTFNTFLDKVFISENKETCNVAIQKNETTILWVHIEGVCESLQGQNKLCYAMVSEISEPTSE